MGSCVFLVGFGVVKKKLLVLVMDGNGYVWSLIGEEVVCFDGE